MFNSATARLRSPDRSSVNFGAVSEYRYELSDREKRDKVAAAAAPLAAAEQVRAANQELGAELLAQRADSERSGALADLSAVRQLISGSPPAAAAGHRYKGASHLQGEMQRPGRDSMEMDSGMSQAREELRLAESILHGTGPSPSGGQFGSPPPQRSTWSNVDVELSAEEQEEIRHKIYGSLLSAADRDSPPPPHQHPMDAEQSALGEERAEASRLRAALLRFDDGDARSNSSLLSDADAAAAQDRDAMASHLERVAYESERSRLQDAEQLAADEQELERLKAEIARNKHFGEEERQQGAHETEFLQAQLDRCAICFPGAVLTL